MTISTLLYLQKRCSITNDDDGSNMRKHDTANSNEKNRICACLNKVKSRRMWYIFLVHYFETNMKRYTCCVHVFTLSCDDEWKEKSRRQVETKHNGRWSLFSLVEFCKRSPQVCDNAAVVLSEIIYAISLSASNLKGLSSIGYHVVRLHWSLVHFEGWMERHHAFFHFIESF